MAPHLLPPPRDHDADLDAFLARSAPPVATGPEVDAEVQALLQAARPDVVVPISSGRRSKLRQRLALGAGAVVLAVSGASMAAADDESPQSFRDETAGWTMSSVTDQMAPGRCAAVGLDLDAGRGSSDDPAFQAAVAYLASLSAEEVDPTEALRAQREKLVTQVDSDGNDVRTVPGKEIWTDTELLPSAYDVTVWDMVEAHLAGRGLQAGQWSAVSVARLCRAPTQHGEESR